MTGYTRHPMSNLLSFTESWEILYLTFITHCALHLFYICVLRAMVRVLFIRLCSCFRWCCCCCRYVADVADDVYCWRWQCGNGTFNVTLQANESHFYGCISEIILQLLVLKYKCSFFKSLLLFVCHTHTGEILNNKSTSAEIAKQKQPQKNKKLVVVEARR